MKHPGTFHHAFRTVYPAIVNRLITKCAVALPASIESSPGKPFHPFQALWDTGATNSVITRKVVDALKIAPTGIAETHGVHGRSQVNTYILDIGLPNRVCIQDVVVSEGVLMDDFDVLIGMDIIQAGDFAIANANRKTTFSFCIPPHCHPVDLLEKSEKVNPKRTFSSR